LLKLSQASLGQTAAGQLVNLLSNDLQRFDTASNFLHYIWIMPLQAVIAFYVMYRSVGIAALAGMIAMALEALPLQGYMSKVQGALRFKIAHLTDHRVKLMSEIVSGIRVIKMYAWEKSFEKVVELARKKEIDIITKTSYIRGFSLSLMVFTERLALYLTLVAFVLIGNRLTSDVVFSMAQLFNSVQLYMCIYYPHGLANFAEAKVSIKRVEEFLLMEENGTRAVLNSTTIGDNPGEIKAEKATASWSLYPVSDTLTDIHLDIVPGTLCCVVGNVGAGKTSLLQMLLRELPLNCGKVDIDGVISYASQEPWLFVSSVRDNILFGRSYEKNRYDEIVRVCALERDFEQFPHGDKTLVEERGVSLSGGQRARINLARAVYAKADIYLLDDPLSAVDTHVGKHLFEECIKKYLNNKTRILVTHQLQFLKQADIIIIMNNVSSFYFLDEIFSRRTLPTMMKLDLKRVQKKLKRALSQLLFYAEYYRYGAGIIVLLSLVFLLIIAQLASNAADLWVTYWTNMDEQKHNLTDSFLVDDDFTLSSGNASEIETDDSMLYTLENSTEPMMFNDSFIFGDMNMEPNEFIGSRDFYIIVYTVFIVASMILTPARSLLFYKIFMNASKGLHNKMFSNVLRAPMRFFDVNPSGRILNRFSNDMGVIDELLPRATLDALQVFLVMSGILMIVFIVSPWMIAPAALLGLLFYYLRVVYLKSAQDVKRLEGVNANELWVPYHPQRRGNKESYLSIEHRYFRIYLPHYMGCRQLEPRMRKKMVINEFDSLQDQHTSTWYTYIACSEIFGFWLDVISTIFLALVTFQFLVFKGENFLSGNVGLVISQSLVLTGMLQIGVRQTAEVASNMTSVERVLQYTKLERESYEHQPTKNLEKDWAHFAKLTYKNPERNWPQSGKVTFKNTYLKYSLDSEPVLKNLNIEIKAGEKVELKSVISSLDQQVCEGGTNLSAGQRQLMCLARAIVRNNKILVMDEATANVDPQLNTIMDSDKVLVMDSGQAVEFSHPHLLLHKPEGFFSKMVKQTGVTMETILRKVAREDYERKCLLNDK
ncbi:hypothetical protein NQ318_017951, partial [Aromia moschata]